MYPRYRIGNSVPEPTYQRPDPTRGRAGLDPPCARFGLASDPLGQCSALPTHLRGGFSFPVITPFHQADQFRVTTIAQGLAPSVPFLCYSCKGRKGGDRRFRRRFRRSPPSTAAGPAPEMEVDLRIAVRVYIG